MASALHPSQMVPIDNDLNARVWPAKCRDNTYASRESPETDVILPNKHNSICNSLEIISIYLIYAWFRFHSIIALIFE